MSNTCGQGLAHHAALPGKMADLIAAVAENLDAHLTALDAKDPQSKPEYDAYSALVRQHRAIETSLRQLSATMASYRDLPMANHDPQVMSGPRVRHAFEQLIREERALTDLLQKWIAEHEQMLR